MASLPQMNWRSYIQSVAIDTAANPLLWRLLTSTLARAEALLHTVAVHGVDLHTHERATRAALYQSLWNAEEGDGDG